MPRTPYHLSDFKARFWAFWTDLVSLILRKSEDPTIEPAPIEPQPPEDPVKPIVPVEEPLKWDTRANSRHSVRVLCDRAGLTLYEKNLITAVIQAESNFNNNAKCYNKNKAGKVTSIDHGVCQINDTPGWHIGPGLYFKSVQDVTDNPDKAVRYMIKMYRAGKLSLWIAFKNGSYKKYMP